MRRRISIQYIAGFFDGEGCVAFQRTRRIREGYSARISLGQKHRKVLDLIHKRLKIGKVYHSLRPQHNQPDYYQFRIAKEIEIVKFLSLVEKHVIVKQAQVKIMLRVLNSGLRGEALRPAYLRLRELKRKRIA